MNRFKWPLLLSTLSVCLLFANPEEAKAVSLKENTQTVVSPGVIRKEYKATVSGRTNRVDVLQIDLNNPYADLEVIAGQGEYTQKATVSQMADRVQAHAALNGDFFNMSKQGAPFGPSFVEGELQSSPLLSVGLFGFGIDGNRTGHIESFTFKGGAYASNGTSYPISGLNKTDYVINHTGVPSHKDSLQLYNDFWAALTRGLKGSPEILVNKNFVVEEINLNGPLPYGVPDGKYILQANGKAKEFIQKNVRVGQKLRLDYNISPNRNWQFLIGGHAMLVNNGSVLPYTLDAKDIDGRRARSAVGLSQNGKTVYLVSTEAKTSRSSGMRLAEWGATLKALGSYKALNLDGGGSTTMVAREHGDFKNTVVTRPEGNGSQRRIVNSIGVMNRAPHGPLAGIAVSGPSNVVQAEVATYGVEKGWDANYHPKDVSQANYAITDTVIGSSAWSGNRFLSSQRGETTIRLQTMEGVVGTKVVKIQSPAALQSFTMNTENSDFVPGATIPVSFDAVTKNKRKISLDPSQMNWAVEGMEATMDLDSWKVRDGNGKLQPPVGTIQLGALENRGFGKVTASFGNFEEQIVVENPEFTKLHMILNNKNYSVGKDWFLMDVEPKIVGDRTLVPIRFVTEAFGANVTWNHDLYHAVIEKDGHRIELPIGENVAYVDGATVPIDVPAILDNDRTMIPIRFVSEHLGMDVNYIHTNRFVDIYGRK